jgi:tRNA-Thr(GGU) m(6)t(6)A37 methyltransferase TsaA
MQPIGIIHTPYQDLKQMPIQPKGAAEKHCEIIIKEEYQAGLADLDGFSHIYLIYLFHRSQGYQLSVLPFMDDQEHGVFATRAPRRPNPIGLSLVELVAIKDNIIQVVGADVLDGTPLLDIKPYIEAFDKVEQARCGWMKASEQAVKNAQSDESFI